MSWESTLEYYRIINTAVKERIGGYHSAKCILFSVDFEEIRNCQLAGDWDEAAAVLGDAARRVERAGADFVLICTNTMHNVASEVQDQITIPLIHIADATAHAIRSRGIRTVGLLGTRYTMEEDFYLGRLEREHGLNVLVPGEADRARVNDIIFDELCLGTVSDSSRTTYCRIIDELSASGAEGVILGCTEISLLVRSEDTRVPLFDTTAIHAERAATMAMSGDAR